MKASLFLAQVAFTAAINAQAAAYQQCGGGAVVSTNCVGGYYCSSQNPYYFQCVPGTATGVPTTKASSTLATTTKSASVTTSTKPASTSTVPKISTPVTSTKPSSTSISSSKPSSTTFAGVSAFTAYAKTSGHVFSINGKPQYFMGTNCYWCGFLTNNADVDLVMSHLVTSGLKVLRVWGFNDVTALPGSGTVYYQSFVNGQAPVINTGANGLQRLDYVVASAEVHGISLIINFVNNWNDYGGMAAYCNYCGISPCTDTTGGWYTSTAVQTQYKAYIAAVVSRYKTSKAIFAWELANEPRCSGCSTSIITTWISATSAYIKSLDPNHMVCIGDEGFGLTNAANPYDYPYSLGPGTNFTTNLAIPTIDFGTFHLYPDSWGESTAWGAGWIDTHAAAGVAAGKPVILEEYGSVTKSNLAPWQAASLADLVAGDMYWQYGDTLSSGVTSDDGNTIYYGSADYATYVLAHAAALNAKAV